MDILFVVFNDYILSFVLLNGHFKIAINAGLCVCVCVCVVWVALSFFSKFFLGLVFEGNIGTQYTDKFEKSRICFGVCETFALEIDRKNETWKWKYFLMKILNYRHVIVVKWFFLFQRLNTIVKNKKIDLFFRFVLIKYHTKTKHANNTLFLCVVFSLSLSFVLSLLNHYTVFRKDATYICSIPFGLWVVRWISYGESKGPFWKYVCIFVWDCSTGNQKKMISGCVYITYIFVKFTWFFFRAWFNLFSAHLEMKRWTLGTLSVFFSFGVPLSDALKQRGYILRSLVFILCFNGCFICGTAFVGMLELVIRGSMKNLLFSVVFMHDSLKHMHHCVYIN